MRKPLALMALGAALAAGVTAAGAANPHAWTNVAVSQNGCLVEATASWDANRVAEVDFYFIAQPGGQFYTPSLNVDPRPARTGSLVAGVQAPKGFRSGHVDAIFLDPKGGLVEIKSAPYDVSSCSP